MIKRRNHRVELKEGVLDEGDTPYISTQKFMYNIYVNGNQKYKFDENKCLIIPCDSSESNMTYSTRRYTGEVYFLVKITYDNYTITLTPSYTSPEEDVLPSSYEDITFVSGPRKVSNNQWVKIIQMLSNSNNYNNLNNSNFFDDFYTKDIGSMQGQLRYWLIRYLWAIKNLLMDSYSCKFIYRLTNFENLIKVLENNSNFTSLWDKIFKTTNGYKQLVTTLDDGYYKDRSYWKIANSMIDDCITKVMFLTEYNNGILNPHYIFKTTLMEEEFPYYFNQDNIYFYEYFYRPYQTVKQLTLLLEMKVKNRLFIIDNFGIVYFDNINSLGPCTFVVYAIQLEVQDEDSNKAILTYDEYCDQTKYKFIRKVKLYLKSYNNPMEYNRVKLISWENKEAWLGIYKYENLDGYLSTKEEICPTKWTALNMFKSNVIQVNWTFKNGSYKSLYNFMTSYDTTGITADAEAACTNLLEYFTPVENGDFGSDNKYFTVFQENSNCRMNVYKRFLASIISTSSEETRDSYIYDVGGDYSYSVISSSKLIPDLNISNINMFIYNLIELRSTLEWSEKLKSFGIKGKAYYSIEDNEMNVDDWIINLLTKVGYKSIEVRDFVGYKRPSISSETEVSVKRDNEIIEYSQVMSLIQEERNRIQDGKIRGNHKVEDEYVVGVIQDERGTYVMVYGAELRNDGKVYATDTDVEGESINETVDIISETVDGDIMIWSKAYNAETLDYRSDNYWKNVLYLQNDDNMSITYEKELWDKLIKKGETGETSPGEMLGYFVVTMKAENSPEEGE